MVHGAGDVAQQLRLPQVELALDVAARLVDQLTTLKLAEDVAALGVDEERLDLFLELDERAQLLPGIE